MLNKPTCNMCDQPIDRNANGAWRHSDGKLRRHTAQPKVSSTPADTTTKITRYFARHADGTEAEVTADIKALTESLRAVTERITSMPLPYVHDESDIGDLGA